VGGPDIAVDRQTHQLGHRVHEAVRRQGHDHDVLREVSIQCGEPGTVKDLARAGPNQCQRVAEVVEWWFGGAADLTAALILAVR
jgi:hypothetical protein